MTKTERAELYTFLFEAMVDYATEPITTYQSYYFLGAIHGIERAIMISDKFDYLSDATYNFMKELIHAQKGDESNAKNH